MGTIEAIAQIPAFYSREGLHTQIYDVFAAEQTGSDIPFWLWCAQTFEGPVLEAACGTGRVSWAIADAGFEVVGLDVSEPMIDRAGAKEGDHPGARASFLVGDMTSFDLRRKFALIVVPARAFQALIRGVPGRLQRVGGVAVEAFIEAAVDVDQANAGSAGIAVGLGC